MLGITEESYFVTLYPNPANEKVILNNSSNATISFTIMSLEGQVIEKGIAEIRITEIKTI